MIEIDTTELIEPHFKHVTELSDLALIQDNNTNITIYEREIPKTLETYLNTLLSNGFNTLYASLNIKNFESIFDEHFNSYSSINKNEHSLLKEDIKKLLYQFSKICNTQRMKVFFGIVHTDMCRRFHVDMYELRMLCSYKGQGTMWLSNDNINYESLKNFESNEPIELRKEDVNQLNTTDVAIIKGALYPNSTIDGLVHRSPTIENLNQKRIVLRIDSNSLIDNL